MSDYSRLGTAVSGLTFKHLLWWDQMIDYFSITDLVLGKTKKNWICAFWETDILNQLFIWGSHSEIKFSKNLSS